MYRVKCETHCHMRKIALHNENYNLQGSITNIFMLRTELTLSDIEHCIYYVQCDTASVYEKLQLCIHMYKKYCSKIPFIHLNRFYK